MCVCVWGEGRGYGYFCSTNHAARFTTKTIKVENVRISNTGVASVSTVVGNRVAKAVSKTKKERTADVFLRGLPSPPRIHSLVSCL